MASGCMGYGFHPEPACYDHNRPTATDRNPHADCQHRTGHGKQRQHTGTILSCEEKSAGNNQYQGMKNMFHRKLTNRTIIQNK